jgi:hypothetical protein
MNLDRWLAVISLVLGLGTSYYFYRLSVAEREPVFISDPNRTLLVELNTIKDSPIRVTRPDGLLIQSDITSLRFYFWNAGRASIKKEHILQPIVISLSEPSVEILDVKLLKVSRQEIVLPVLQPAKDSPLRSLALEFAILEEGDGLAAQIIYAGPPQAEVRISGTIEGVRQIATNQDVAQGRFLRELVGMPLAWIRRPSTMEILAIVLSGALLFELREYWSDKKKGEIAPVSRSRLIVRYGLVVLVLLGWGGLLVTELLEPILKAQATATETVALSVPLNIRP